MFVVTNSSPNTCMYQQAYLRSKDNCPTDFTPSGGPLLLLESFIGTTNFHQRLSANSVAGISHSKPLGFLEFQDLCQCACNWRILGRQHLRILQVLPKWALQILQIIQFLIYVTSRIICIFIDSSVPECAIRVPCVIVKSLDEHIIKRVPSALSSLQGTLKVQAFN